MKAIRENSRIVEIRNAYEFPRDALSLMAYDVVIFVNVGVESFDVVQLGAVQDAVENLGVGFLMTGGPNSFGPGGYRKTVIEEILPVEMDITKKKVLPKGALAAWPRQGVWIPMAMLPGALAGPGTTSRRPREAEA